jgi:hypothetical protein
MSGALNLVEILASIYLLAIIGVLAYANVRVFMAKRSVNHLFSGQAHRGYPHDDGTSQQRAAGYLPFKSGR